MNSLHLVLLLYCIIELKCNKDVTSDEKPKKDQERSDKIIVNANRRFHAEQNDEEWHISHLKETDVLENSYCQGETLEEKIIKYKKALLNDGALIDFVSADMLPQNESEIMSYKCKNNGSQWFNGMTAKDNSNSKKSKAHSNDVKIQSESLSKTFRSHTEPNSEPVKTVSKSKAEAGQLEKLKTSQTDTATTAKMKPSSKRNKDRNETVGEKRRASEYMFSSVEYYDETIDFEAAKCPDAVDIITLEIDQLRTYDVECEMTLEWKSLD